MNRPEYREDRLIDRYEAGQEAKAFERDQAEDAEVAFWRRLRKRKREAHERGEHTYRAADCPVCEQT